MKLAQKQPLELEDGLNHQKKPWEKLFSLANKIINKSSAYIYIYMSIYKYICSFAEMTGYLANRVIPEKRVKTNIDQEKAT